MPNFHICIGVLFGVLIIVLMVAAFISKGRE